MTARAKIPEVSVCIPTYQRPEMLGRCLEALQRQEHAGFAYSVTVVDNDASESARPVVEFWQQRSPFPLSYHVEPVRSISLARNRAVASSTGEMIAFVDDDEFPEPTWLASLMDACRRFSVDGVFGPVLPQYEGSPPRWLPKSRLCERASFATGTILRSSRNMSTANVLISRRMLAGEGAPFDPRFGRTGGEDTDFFSRMAAGGRRFAWCNEARVYEAVPQERQKRAYFIRRALLRGVTTAGRERFLSLGTVKSVAAVVAYTISLPFLLVAGQHLFMRYFVKECDHVAKLLAHCGIRLARERAW